MTIINMYTKAVYKQFKFIDMNIVWWFQTKLPARPEVTRGDPLTSQQWSKHMDKEGKIINVEEVKDQIFRGVRNGV